MPSMLYPRNRTSLSSEMAVGWMPEGRSAMMRSRNTRPEWRNYAGYAGYVGCNGPRGLIKSRKLQSPIAPPETVVCPLLLVPYCFAIAFPYCFSLLLPALRPSFASGVGIPVARSPYAGGFVHSVRGKLCLSALSSSLSVLLFQSKLDGLVRSFAKASRKAHDLENGSHPIFRLRFNRLLYRQRQGNRGEPVRWIEIVLTALIDDPQVAVRPRIVVGQDTINLM